MSDNQSNTTYSQGSSDAANLVSTLLQRAPRLATAVAGAQLAAPVVRNVVRQQAEQRRYSIKVLSNDALYPHLHAWVLSMLPSARQRSLLARSNRVRDDHAPSPASSSFSSGPGSAGNAEQLVSLLYDGSRQQSIVVDGHRLRVSVNVGDAPGRRERLDEFLRPDELVFFMRTVQARDRLLAEMRSIAERLHRAHRAPQFRMLNRWGDWQFLEQVPARSLDSVILASGQLERVVGDVQRFMAAESEYARRDQPWHRAHLYTGPPGTGKTSVAKALATHLGLDVWYLPLADMDKDCNLLGVVSRVGPRSMLLLEDVDAFQTARKRDPNHAGGVTISGLLNTLDGIATPHGLFTVLTTNDQQALDSALVRPGRVDLIERFNLATHDQAERIVARWYDLDPAKVNWSPVANLNGLAPAAIVETCKRYDEPVAALAALKRLARTGQQS